MEFHQFEYLVAVVDEASFTSAASKLRVSQPTVSAQIRRLEQELGVQLLDRSSRTITPTDAGREILPYARASLQARDSARDAAGEFAGLKRGRVTIGVVPPPLDFLPELLAEFHQAHPRVDITLHEAISGRLVAGLLEGTLDIAITSLPSAPPEGLRHFTVVTSPIAALVRSDDELAGRPRVPLSSLRGRRLICHPADSGIRSVFESASPQQDSRRGSPSRPVRPKGWPNSSPEDWGQQWRKHASTRPHCAPSSSPTPNSMGTSCSPGARRGT